MTSIAQAGVSAELISANQRLLDQRKKMSRLSTRTKAQCPGKGLANSFKNPPTLSAWGLSLHPTLEQEPDLSAKTTPIDDINQANINDTCRHYPDLGLAWLRQEQAAVGRVWLLGRHLDSDGRGWITLNNLRRQLTNKESKLRLCGWRRLRAILNQGEGVFWSRQTCKNGQVRVWLFSAEKHASLLNVTKLNGKPIQLPIKALLDGMKIVRANFYAAFHSGRYNDNPISRQTLEKLSGIAGRTQRTYDDVLGVEKQSSIAIGPACTTVDAQSHIAERGAGTFVFIDRKGKLGAIGRKYHAWRLPNRYAPLHQSAQRGRQRKINRKLKSQIDLVDLRAQGNDLSQRQRLFFANTKLQVNPSGDSYWYNTQAKVWHNVTPINRTKTQDATNRKNSKNNTACSTDGSF